MATQGSHSQQQLMRSSERRMFLASDDGALMKQIQSAHSPDGRFIDVKPILRIIDNVLRHLTPNIDHHALNGGQGHMDAIDDMSSSAAMDGNCMLDALAYVIHKISCEVIWLFVTHTILLN
ncbi:hypothetical protein HRI_004919200 [Hibiscus trionum]|uniref:Sieve element occlusion N-terminal domain-containing protein n=1 Tax=Hibiscus trionum TaxID=183268 RepID=A0A9W7JDF7_HIBTR|nr:hypothetical protein HRI_004919200 [Hibiscus trionum]